MRDTPYQRGMWLRRETLEEFKAICRDEFGVELSDVEAHERAVAVLDLFSLLYLERRVEDDDFDSTEARAVL